jgi:hypothetical protein
MFEAARLAAARHMIVDPLCASKRCAADMSSTPVSKAINARFRPREGPCRGGQCRQKRRDQEIEVAIGDGRLRAQAFLAGLLPTGRARAAPIG